MRTWSNWLHHFLHCCFHFLYFFWFSLQRLSILCFRHDHHYPETPQPEVIEHYLHEELVQSEFNDSSVTKRDWKSTIQKVTCLLFTLITNGFPFPMWMCCVVWCGYLKIGSLINEYVCYWNWNLHLWALPSSFMVMACQAKFTHTNLFIMVYIKFCFFTHTCSKIARVIIWYGLQ